MFSYINRILSLQNKERVLSLNLLNLWLKDCSISRCGNCTSAINQETNKKAHETTTTSKTNNLLNNMLEDSCVIEPKKRNKIDPKSTSVILFPGQGTQYVGMASKLLRFPEALRIYKMANEILGYDLLKLCLEGPCEKLNRTEYAQLAVMVSSLAALEQLQEERPQAIENCTATAGFSLGEFTALVFAGTIPFDKALKLVQIRATAMQAACDLIPGGMAMVLYAPDSELGIACLKAHQWCIDRGVENPYCGVSNYMYPHCKIIAGNVEALDFLEQNAKSFKIRRMKKLPVSGAFHTPLMESAVAPFAKALNNIQLKEPLIRVYSNIDGKPYKNVAHIRRMLPKQIVKSVKWEQTLHEIYARQQGEDFPRTFECGPGSGLIQTLEKVNAKAANSALSIEA